MTTANFQNLIQLITGRDFLIKTEDIELQFEKEYVIYRILPVSKRSVSFIWKTPKADEKMLRSFITAFCSKYREPNPRAYDYMAKTYGEQCKWENKTEQDREFAYMHHSSNMYSKDALLKQVEDNFANDKIATGLIKYGFYNTEYGIGIFCFWMTTGVNTAINTMKAHLQKLSIPFTNEFSDAKWVYRFRLGLTKEAHLSIINKLN
tara:strand:+ start:3263 stop:3880 length:618 start_codon:yes stop_codon:yes gene_type:complete